MSFFSFKKLFKGKKEDPLAKTVTVKEQQVAIKAPVTFYKKGSREQGYFIDYRGQKDYSKNRRLSKPVKEFND